MTIGSNDGISGTAQDRIDAILGRGKYKPTSNQPPPNLPGGIPSLVLQTPDSSRSPRLERLSGHNTSPKHWGNILL